MAWLSGWSYRKEITITGQSGAGTNFQVDLDIGASAGGDFHLEGHCTNFPQDIEVTDNDGTTLLKFWIADLTADPLEMTVKVADDLGSNQTIYIYYGKSGATTNSNGANTFLQYHGAATTQFIDSLNIVPSNIIVESRSWWDAGTADIRFGLSNTQIVQTDDSICVSSDLGGSKYAFVYNEGSITYNSDTPVSGDTWYRLKSILISTTTAQGFLDDVQIGGDLTTNIPDENLGLVMHFLTGTGKQDWSFVRKYNSPEPAFSSAGSEETPPVTGNPYWYYQMLKRRN